MAVFKNAATELAYYKLQFRKASFVFFVPLPFLKTFFRANRCAQLLWIKIK